MQTFKTTGDFMLLDPQSRVVFEPHKPTQSELTSFVGERLKLKQLEEVAEEGVIPEVAAVGKDAERLTQPPEIKPKGKKGK